MKILNLYAGIGGNRKLWGNGVTSKNNKFIRCNATIDIEEIIAVKKEENLTKATAVATYKSGRQEEFSCNLRADKSCTLMFQKKVRDLRAFPNSGFGCCREALA